MCSRGQKREENGSISAQKIIALTGKDAREGVYFFNRYVAYAQPKGKEEENKQLNEVYQKIHPNQVPDMCAALDCDALHIMAGGIERAGALKPAKIRAGLGNTDYFELAGRVKFDENNHPQPRGSLY